MRAVHGRCASHLRLDRFGGPGDHHTLGRVLIGTLCVPSRIQHLKNDIGLMAMMFEWGFVDCWNKARDEMLAREEVPCQRWLSVSGPKVCMSEQE